MKPKKIILIVMTFVIMTAVSCKNKEYVEEVEIMFQDPIFEQVLKDAEYKKKSGDVIPIKLTEKNIGQMTSLSLFFNGHNNYSLKDLNKFPNLRALWINGLTDQSVLELSEMHQLRALYITSKITTTDYKPIGTMKNIKALEISGEYEDWSFISQMTQLETLVLDEVTTDNLDFVKTLTNLKRLTIEDSNIIDTSALQYLVNVKYMKLTELSNQDQHYSSSIASMKKIEQLAIYRDKSLEQLNFLKKIKKLNSLYLMDLGVKELPKWLTPEEYPELTILSLDETIEQYNIEYMEKYGPILEERYEKGIPENNFFDERLGFPILLEKMIPLDVFDNPK